MAKAYGRFMRTVVTHSILLLPLSLAAALLLFGSNQAWSCWPFAFLNPDSPPEIIVAFVQPSAVIFPPSREFQEATAIHEGGNGMYYILLALLAVPGMVFMAFLFFFLRRKTTAP